MKHYQHLDIDNRPIDLPNGKVICVGRNYCEHAKELNNPVPNEPILFIKPTTSLVPFENQIKVSNRAYDIHYELEVCILIGLTLSNANKDQAKNAITGLGLSLDLTLRDLQDQLKSKGLPWEKAKAFDQSCPVSNFITKIDDIDLGLLDFTLTINSKTKQLGSSSDMIVDILGLITFISRHFTLLPGDIILTGSPSGVGKLNAGDKLRAKLSGMPCIETTTY